VNTINFILAQLGLDPITFNYRVNELLADTVKDFFTLKETIIRETGLYYQYRGDAFQTNQVLCKVLHQSEY